MAVCPVCGKKISFMEGYSFFNTSICYECHTLTDTDFLTSLSSQTISEKIDGIEKMLKRKGITEKTRSDLLHIRRILKEGYEEQIQKEKAKHESDESIRGFKISSLQIEPGYKIKETMGLVYINPRQEDIAFTTYDEWMQDSLKALSKKAFSLGANAILDFKITQQGSYFDNCIMYGTAVLLEKDSH